MGSASHVLAAGREDAPSAIRRGAVKHWPPSLESWVALLLVCIGVVPTMIHGGLTEQMSPAWLFAWLFAISGLRRSQGAARLAAVVGLTVLVFHAISLVAMGILAAR